MAKVKVKTKAKTKVRPKAKKAKTKAKAKSKARVKVQPKPAVAAKAKLALINIWDDYYDDGYVPKGERQGTRIYLENIDVPQAEATALLKFLLAEVKSMKEFSSAKFSMAKYKNGDPKIQVIGLTHAQRRKLLSALAKKNTFAFGDWKFDFASES